MSIENEEGISEASEQEVIRETVKKLYDIEDN